jgi:3-deoxy-D-manno-octulosonic-acid transferase
MLGPDQHVLVFGSTVEGEELLLVSCFKAVLKEFPDALIVLAPRHPERFDAVGELLRSSGMTFWRRSGWNSTRIAGGVLLLDTIGELASVYSLATIAFVGGSLVARGGHNILEPAQFAKPIVIGPYYENFREIVREFLKNWAVIVVPAEQLTASVLQLLRSPEECATYGQRAAALVSAGRGSTQRTLDSVVELLSARSISKAEMASPQI